MFRKSFVFILIVASSCAVALAQKTPEAKKGTVVTPRTFAWSLGDEGGSYLGVQTQEVNRDNFGKFGLRDVRGVAVEKVMDNSPAQAAGLQNGDVIVTYYTGPNCDETSIHWGRIRV